MSPVRAVALASVLLSCSATAFAACADRGRARSGAEILDDSGITTHVKVALRSDADVDARDIEVRTCRREVRLSGFVPSPREVERAGEITAGVEGVRHVTNTLVPKALQLAQAPPACARERCRP